MARVIVLGGGFGGLAAAHTLRQSLPAEAEIVVVDRRDSFVFGFRKTWAFLGSEPLETARRPLRSLERLGIQIRRGELESVDLDGRRAVVGGETHSADALVIALGARPAPETVPGLAEHSVSFYSSEAIPRAARALEGFRGGRVLVAIAGVPYPCPPAPFEAALLLRERFESLGSDAEIEVSSPQPMSLPALGPAGCSVIEGRLEQRGIRFRPSQALLRADSKTVLYPSGPRPYDLLIGIPPHRCPDPIAGSPLIGPSGWVKVDPRTLETSYPGVYALGDLVDIPLADGKRLPQAGVFAERQGEVVARRIAARLRGAEPQAEFDGRGHCFLEIGGGQAMLVQGEFLAAPAPKVELTEPSSESLAQKRRWEAERLQAWFGG
jgi:sulfide:quinone oxidoreductase